MTSDSKPRYTKDVFDQIVYYDPSSETCLRWCSTVRNPISNNVTHLADAVAGCLHTWKGRPRYSVVYINSKLYYIGRVIYCLVIGDVPDNMVIDHIDGNPFNNNITNLRLVTHQTNAQNIRKKSNNTSGSTGVGYRKDRNSYRAFWVEDGKFRSKSFSCEQYGDDLAKTLAEEYRSAQIARLNSEGNQYTARHGKDTL